MPALWQKAPHTATAHSGNQFPLMQWGTIQFRIWPLNFHEMDHETATDWAHKEIAGAPIYREWVGENDETLYVRGKLFPYRINGDLTAIEILDAQRRAGIAHVLIRGDGEYLGWYVIDKLVRNHTFISGEGVGRQIAFEAVFVRVPVPPADNYYSDLFRSGALGR